MSLEEVKVVQLPDDATGKLRLISALEDLLAEAQSGELLGLSWVGERKNKEVIWGKSNAIYHLQLTWDQFSREQDGNK